MRQSVIVTATRQVLEPPTGWGFEQVLDQAKRVSERIAGVLTFNAKVKGAEILYEELSKLSDAELERRGIPRADLPRYVLETLDRE